MEESSIALVNGSAERNERYKVNEMFCSSPLFKSLSSLLFLTIPLVAFAELPSSQSSRQPTVAAILPLTGNASDQGSWARRGLEIATEEIEPEVGPSYLVYEDSKGGDPRSAVYAYRALTASHAIAGVITYGSGVGMALTPLVNGSKIIQIGIATATPAYRTMNDYTFRVFPSASIEAEFLSKAIIRQIKPKRIAVLSVDNDYGVGTAEAVTELLARDGLLPFFRQTYAPSETDFRSLLLPLRREPDALIYLASYPVDGALILRQARVMGIKNQFIASPAIIGGEQFFSTAAGAAEGLLVSSQQLDTKGQFYRRYNELYPGESPAQLLYAARAYDALKLFAHAEQACKSADTSCIKDELSKVKDYPGASGVFSFDDAGDITTEFGLFRVRGKVFENF